MAAGLIHRVSLNIFKNATQFLNNSLNGVKLDQPVRSNWTNWHMRKDYMKRQELIRDGPERLRLKCVKKNDLLPTELLEVGRDRLAAMPRNGSINKIRFRCAVTSRPRGVVYRWRLSRIVWRHLADYNKLSAVQRAMW